MNGELPQQPPPPPSLPVPFPPPPALPDRRGWLIAFGILQILIGLFMLLVAVTTSVSMATAAAKMPQARITIGTIMFIAVFYSAIGFVFITLGIGSALAKNWARIANVVLSSLWLIFGVLGGLMMAVVMPAVMDQAIQQQPQGQALPENFGAIMKVFMLGFMAIFMVLLPGLLLFFYTRKSVRATCLQRSGGTESVNQRPIAVWALLVLYGIGIPGTLYAIFAAPGSMLFGVAVTGVAHKSMMTVALAIYIFIWLKIYRMERVGWQAALGLQLFYFVSTCVTVLLRHDLIQLYREIGMNEEQLKFLTASPMMLPAIFVGTLIWAAAFLGFIAYSGRYFKDPAAPLAAQV